MKKVSEEDLPDLHAGVCRALADPKRILIMYALAEEPRHVTALADDLGLPQSTVSRHLQVLRQQALVTTERTGPSVIYGLADPRIITVLDTTHQMMIDAQARRGLVLEAVPDL